MDTGDPTRRALLSTIGAGVAGVATGASSASARGAVGESDGTEIAIGYESCSRVHVYGDNDEASSVEVRFAYYDPAEGLRYPTVELPAPDFPVTFDGAEGAPEDATVIVQQVTVWGPDGRFASLAYPDSLECETLLEEARAEGEADADRRDEGDQGDERVEGREAEDDDPDAEDEIRIEVEDEDDGDGEGDGPDADGSDDDRDGRGGNEDEGGDEGGDEDD